MKETKMGNYRWTICALLFFATTVNYLDRQVLSLLHTKLEAEFNWTNSDYANITAAFQLVYAISMLFAGRIVDKLGTKWGYAVALIVWSLGAILHAKAIPVGEGLASMLGLIGITAAFLVIGAVGFLWLIFWFMFYEKPEQQKRLSKAELDYILCDPDQQAIVPSASETEA
eukprot:gene15000-18162_t